MRTEREKVRDILNNSRDINFSHATETVKNLIQSKAEAPFIINHIVTKAKLVKGTISTVQLFQIFYHYTKEIVAGNRFCRTEYQKQMFLKNIWITSNLQTMVMDQIRKGYKMILEPEEYKEKTAEEIAEEVRLARLEKQAAKMRVGKANKRRAMALGISIEDYKDLKKEAKKLRLSLESLLNDLDPDYVKPVVVTKVPVVSEKKSQPTDQDKIQDKIQEKPVPTYKKKPMNQAQLDHIAMLKNTKV